MNEPASLELPSGKCGACGHSFTYRLIHNGFNDSNFAYCTACGVTALLSGWATNIPSGISLGSTYGPVPPELERLLAPCACGGQFSGSASPRCPKCRVPLSAMDATSYIEAQAPGTKGGWRWQRTWKGLYCLVIEGHVVNDPWLPQEATP